MSKLLNLVVLIILLAVAYGVYYCVDKVKEIVKIAEEIRDSNPCIDVCMNGMRGRINFANRVARNNL